MLSQRRHRGAPPAPRRAQAVTLAPLKRLKPPRGGIIHAFAGSYEEAREYLKLGFKLGLGGAPTWGQARRLQRGLSRMKRGMGAFRV